MAKISSTSIELNYIVQEDFISLKLSNKNLLKPKKTKYVYLASGFDFSPDRRVGVVEGCSTVLSTGSLSVPN